MNNKHSENKLKPCQHKNKHPDVYLAISGNFNHVSGLHTTNFSAILWTALQGL